MINGLNNMYNDITNLYDINADDITSTNLVTESINGQDASLFDGLSSNIQNQLDTLNSGITSSGGGGCFSIEAAMTGGFLASRYFQFGGSASVLANNVPLQFDYDFVLTGINIQILQSMGAATATVKLIKNNVSVQTILIDSVNVNYIGINITYLKGDKLNLYCSDAPLPGANNNGNFVRATISCQTNGITGPQGVAGTNGTSFNWRSLWSNSATYVAKDVVQYNGSSYIAIASNSNSTPPSPNWSLMSSKGDTGVAGLKGDTGLQGIQGLKGDTGLQGSQGLQGLQGLKGDTGLQGIQGLKGDTGLQGIQGIQGIQGPQGSRGIQGIPGEMPDMSNYVDIFTDQYIEGIKTFVDPPLMSGENIGNNSIPLASINGIGNFVDTYTDQNIESTKTFINPPIMSGSRISNNSIPLAAINGLNANYVRRNVAQNIIGEFSFTTNPIFNDNSIPVSKLSGFVAPTNGINGTNGTNGIDGQNGIDGLNGANGENGANGLNGLDGVSFIWRDIWDSTILYNINDVVQYNGSSYVCIIQNIDSLPSISSIYWKLMAQKGEDGQVSNMADYYTKTQTDDGFVRKITSISDFDNFFNGLITDLKNANFNQFVTDVNNSISKITGDITDLLEKYLLVATKLVNNIGTIPGFTTFTGRLVMYSGENPLNGLQIYDNGIDTNLSTINIGHLQDGSSTQTPNVNLRGNLFINNIAYEPFSSTTTVFNQW